MNTERIFSVVRRYVPTRGRARLKRWAQHSILVRCAFGRNIPVLCRLFGTDKWGVHRYAGHYQTHFAPIRRRRINLLEIGVGGHDDPNAGGSSLRMWKMYFPRARIYGIDVFDKSGMEEERIRVFRGSQADPDFLHRVAKEIGQVDIVIDDGSHVNEHVLTSFETLFPYLSEGGIYVIEDMQTSYWTDFGGSEDPHEERTSVGLCKRLIDGMNWEEFFKRSPRPFDAEVTAVHVYHNLAFIHKGMNREGSTKSRKHLVHLG